jgi:serine/threonine protein phosphatase 1
LIWIREPFLGSTRDYGRLIVHGHTPLDGDAPDLRANRLNLDTGAVFGGPLTAAVFSDAATPPLAFLQAE